MLLKALIATLCGLALVELPPGAEESIAGIRLLDPQSAHAVLDSIEPETEEYGITRYRFFSAGASEVITLTQNPGDTRLCIAEVWVQKATGGESLPVFPSQPNHFISGRGVRIGLTKIEVKSLLRNPTDESEDSLMYRLRGDLALEWLKDHNRSEYRGIYYFQDGKLVAFYFGFPYP